MLAKWRWPTFDPRPFSRGGSVAIVTVAALKLYIAWLLWTQPLTANATNVRSILLGFEWAGAPDGRTFTICVIIVYVILAIVGVVLRLGYVRLLLFIPLGALLGMAAFGGQAAAVMGHYFDGTAYYPNGVKIPWQHISADQAGDAALLIVYISGIFRRCRDPNG